MEVDDAATPASSVSVGRGLDAGTKNIISGGAQRKNSAKIQNPIDNGISNEGDVLTERKTRTSSMKRNSGSADSEVPIKLRLTSDEDGSDFDAFQSDEALSLKRKRFKLRRSGSKDCLLGFDEESGEAELVKDDGQMEITENTSSQEVSPRQTKRFKKNPASGKSSPSPRAQASASTKNDFQSKNITDKTIKAHVVGDNEENGETQTDSQSHTSQTSNTNPSSMKSSLTSNDNYYFKPFEHGWKRELVWRTNLESNKEKADVYFITPSGKKLRSRNEIIPLLEGDLTIEHFYFTREALGLGPEYETVRTVKSTGRTSVAAATLAAAHSPGNMGKRVSKPKGPKGASPPPEGWTPTRALKVNNAALHSSSSSSIKPNSSSTNSLPTTPSRNLSSAHSNREHNSASKNVAGNSKSKKHANDIENDLRQIKEGIQHTNRKTSVGLNVEATIAAVERSNKLFAANFFANVSYAYDALVCILKYLKIHERSRAASVCKLWNLAAKDTSLWQTVRMKNSKVCNWSGFAAALRRGETKHLDLRKMLLSSGRGDEMWQAFSEHIGTVCSLEIIDLCRCSARVVESLFESNRRLRVLNAIAINDDALNLENVGLMTELEELRLRTCEPSIIVGDLQQLRALTKLTHLSLTAIRGLGSKGIEVLAELPTLRSLELGECGDFESVFAEIVLPPLTNLNRLRLENGTETACCTLSILEAVSQLKQLSQLELVNFDIKPGFDEKLCKCNNIRKLLIIPTYISQSATTNHIVLSAVQQIAESLQVFTWGVTVELLRVTALYVDQCDDSMKKKKHHFDECIPVLKPVPGAPPAEDDDSSKNVGIQQTPSDVPQIEILPLEKVETILGENLPQTKFTIVKVPYIATSKQQLVE